MHRCSVVDGTTNGEFYLVFDLSRLLAFFLHYTCIGFSSCRSSLISSIGQRERPDFYLYISIILLKHFYTLYSTFLLIQMDCILVYL